MKRYSEKQHLNLPVITNTIEHNYIAINVKQESLAIAKMTAQNQPTIAQESPHYNLITIRR